MTAMRVAYECGLPELKSVRFMRQVHGFSDLMHLPHRQVPVARESARSHAPCASSSAVEIGPG